MRRNSRVLALYSRMLREIGGHGGGCQRVNPMPEVFGISTIQCEPYLLVDFSDLLKLFLPFKPVRRGPGPKTKHFSWTNGYPSWMISTDQNDREEDKLLSQITSLTLRSLSPPILSRINNHQIRIDCTTSNKSCLKKSRIKKWWNNYQAMISNLNSFVSPWFLRIRLHRILLINSDLSLMIQIRFFLPKSSPPKLTLKRQPTTPTIQSASISNISLIFYLLYLINKTHNHPPSPNHSCAIKRPQ